MWPVVKVPLLRTIVKKYWIKSLPISSVKHYPCKCNKTKSFIIYSILQVGSSLQAEVPVLIEDMFIFLKSKVKTLKIILMESIKDVSGNAAIFIMEKYFNACGQICLDCCYDQKNPNDPKTKTEEFFLKYIPLINFVIFHEKWTEYQGLKKDKVISLFSKAYFDTFKFVLN